MSREDYSELSEYMLREDGPSRGDGSKEYEPNDDEGEQIGCIGLFIILALLPMLVLWWFFCGNAK